MAKHTIQQLASEVGVSRQSLSEWKRLGCPVTSVDEIAAWRANHLSPRPGSVPLNGESHAARLLRNKADAEGEKAAFLRLKNSQRRGELVEKVEIVREFAEFL